MIKHLLSKYLRPDKNITIYIIYQSIAYKEIVFCTYFFRKTKIQFLFQMIFLSFSTKYVHKSVSICCRSTNSAKMNYRRTHEQKVSQYFKQTYRKISCQKVVLEKNWTLAKMKHGHLVMHFAWEKKISCTLCKKESSINRNVFSSSNKNR